MASSQSSPTPVADGGFFQPVFNPAALATPTTPPVYVFESLGPTTGKSCLARVGPVCTFTAPECCSAAQGSPTFFFIPGLATQVPCHGAKMRYNSTLSAAFTNAQCNATRNLIISNAGLFCECQAAPTPAPKLLGSCVSRDNGSAFTPCDFLPADRTPAGCCPMKQDEGILNLDRSIIDADYVSCGFANQTLYTNRSSAWSDDWCAQTKQAIEAEAYMVDGCVCPGSDKLNTSAPSRAPAVPSAPPSPSPTTIDTFKGSCVSRASGSAFTPCDFLPADRTPAGCCPMEQYEGILNIDPTIIDADYVSCGFVNETLYTNRSSAWPDEWCYQMKLAIEEQGYIVDGCVCPGSDKLNTSEPSRAPAVPSAPPTPLPTIADTSAPTSPAPVVPIAPPTPIPTTAETLNTSAPSQTPAAVPIAVATSRPTTSGVSRVATGATVLALFGFFL